MRSSVRGLAAVLLATAAWLSASIAPADAQIAFAPCKNSNDFACGHLTVPLDPSGVTPGTITLALRRHRAPVGDAHSAIVALAGGPGQPALPFAEQFAELLGPIADARDLIVFDQRGIGLSAPLSCHALEVPGLFHSLSSAIETCAKQLGPTRDLYTTPDTVADIEALRRAGSYEKLVLYGTSYGTKVAEEYAQRYPDHVEALVLDSVVPPDGPEPFDRSTFAAIPRVLRALCAARACAHTTRDPVADLARLLQRMAHRGLSGQAIDGHGVAHRVPLSSAAILGTLLSGDFAPLLRAQLVTADAAAARGDTAPMARLLNALARGGGGESEDFDTPLYFATTCEEEDFPWSRTSSPRARLAQALASLRALPAGAFAPFSADNALQLSDLGACAHWPFTTPAPLTQDAPLPNAPTLLLSGAQDLRTPTANAREVAREIPDAQLLVVPHTGHSVLTQDVSGCANRALQALFSTHPIEQCLATPLPRALLPPPLPPRLLAAVAPSAGYGGLPGQTLHAVALTLGDLGRSLFLAVELSGASESLFEPTLRAGGLRAGWAQLASGTLSLHGYTFINGLTLTGSIKADTESLRVGGTAAAHGTLHMGAHRALVGTLGGRHVVLPAGATATAAIVSHDAVASYDHGRRGAAERALARRLAKLLGRFQP